VSDGSALVRGGEWDAENRNKRRVPIDCQQSSIGWFAAEYGGYGLTISLRK